jgi:hypothetical protein
MIPRGATTRDLGSNSRTSIAEALKNVTTRASLSLGVVTLASSTMIP